MKYETPALTALTLAIKAVHGPPKDAASLLEGPSNNEVIGAYADWE